MHGMGRCSEQGGQITRPFTKLLGCHPFRRMGIAAIIVDIEDAKDLVC